MRFVVDLFRYIVLAGVAILLIVGSFLVFSIFAADGTVFDGITIATALGFFVGGIILLGGLAGLISTHDRIAEMSDSLAQISESLSTLADRDLNNSGPRNG